MPHDKWIFVVDDDVAVLDSMAALLEANGYKARCFPSGRAFLDQLNPAWRGCVLLDVRMPDIDGLAVQEELVAMGAALAVILVTGHGDVPMAVKAMKRGAVDFIEKPFTEDLIVGAIEHALSETPDEGAAARGDEAAARLALLTPREREVLDHLVIGDPNKIIAHKLDLSPRTVEVHRARVMAKMKASSLSHLVRLALAAGLDPDRP